MFKVARQTKLVTTLQQTKLLNTWLKRQHLQAADKHEQQMLDGEAEAIAEMEGISQEMHHSQGSSVQEQVE